MPEIPTIETSFYGSSPASAVGEGAATWAGLGAAALGNVLDAKQLVHARRVASPSLMALLAPDIREDPEPLLSLETKLITMPKRIVRVYLADTDDNLPLDRCLLYTGSEKLTDLTDQELYFEIPINDLLTKHNAYRATVVDKKATSKVGKEIFLEPVKIRDLKMLVVCIASLG